MAESENSAVGCVSSLVLDAPDQRRMESSERLATCVMLRLISAFFMPPEGTSIRSTDFEGEL